MTWPRQQETSLEAFVSLNPDDVEGVKDAILAALMQQPGTSAQVAHRLHLTEYQVSKRTSDLLNEGRIYRGGFAKNPSGRRAYVLHPTGGL